MKKKLYSKLTSKRGFSIDDHEAESEAANHRTSKVRTAAREHDTDH